MVPARFLLKLGGLGRIGGFKSEREKEKYIQTQVYINIYIYVYKYIKELYI